MSIRAGLLAALTLTSVVCTGAARAAELVMVELDGCAWCLKWHRTIGSVYGKTAEGALLPLRRVALGTVQGVSVAPTFMVVDCGIEQGRIVGFNGEDPFWGDLAAIIAKMKREGRPQAKC